MRSIIAIVCILFLCPLLHAQNLQWVKGYGTGTGKGYAMAIDGAGNVYTSGAFRSTISFGPGPGAAAATSQGGEDIYIIKQDAAGQVLWAKAMGGPGDDRSTALALDSAGNVYLTGYFYGTVDFDPDSTVNNSLTAAGMDDIFILKLSPAGVTQWARRIGGTEGEEGNGIAVDKAGNVFTTGVFLGVVDFDPGTGTNNLGDNTWGHTAFILKLNTAGNFVWARCFEQASNTFPNVAGTTITLDARGNVLTSGYYVGTIDFDPGAGSHPLTSRVGGSYDMYVSKLSGAGTYVWAKTLSGTADDLAACIKTDAAGNIYTTGTFEGKTDFDPGTDSFYLTTAGTKDIFISKLDSNGAFTWAKAIGGPSYDYGAAITVDDSGTIYATGDFVGTVDFDPSATVHNLVSAAYYDQFIMKLTPAGNYVWAKNTTGPNSHSFGNAIATDRTGHVYTTGFYMNTVDFDPNAGTYNLTSSAPAQDDIFVMKLGPEGTGITGVTPEGDIRIVPNPTTGSILVESGAPFHNATVSIVSITGQVVQRREGVHGDHITLDISGEAAGVYFLSIETGGTVLYRKVVKQ